MACCCRRTVCGGQPWRDRVGAGQETMASDCRGSEPDRSVVARGPVTPNPIGRRLTLSSAGSASRRRSRTAPRRAGHSAQRRRGPAGRPRPVGGHLDRTPTKAHRAAGSRSMTAAVARTTGGDLAGPFRVAAPGDAERRGGSGAVGDGSVVRPGQAKRPRRRGTREERRRGAPGKTEGHRIPG